MKVLRSTVDITYTVTLTLEEMEYLKGITQNNPDRPAVEPPQDEAIRCGLFEGFAQALCAKKIHSEFQEA